jgi:adenylate cyclase
MWSCRAIASAGIQLYMLGRIRQHCWRTCQLSHYRLLAFRAAKEHDGDLIVPKFSLGRTMASSVPDGLRWQTARQAMCVPNECSIALLPLRNLSGATEDDAVCAGIIGDVIHNLTRFRDLTVIAQHSALRIQAFALKPRRIAERLGIRYVLLGALRRRGDRLEVSARLLKTDCEQVVWSRKFEGPLGDVFAFQDEVTEVIAVNLAAEIRAAELCRAVDAAPAKLSAYGLILRGQYLTHRYQRATNLEARLLFERARRVDPGYVRSYAALSRTFNLDWRYGWSEDPSASLTLALELAVLAVEYDPFDARGHGELGFAFLYCKQHEAALAAYERAIELNPNDADILAEMGDALGYIGQNVRALPLLDRAMRLNPLYPDWYLLLLAGVYFNVCDYRRAIDALERMRDLSEAHRMLASGYAHLGRMEEARHHAAQVMKVHPNFSIDHWREVPPFKDQQPLELLIDGMRQAGLR